MSNLPQKPVFNGTPQNEELSIKDSINKLPIFAIMAADKIVSLLENEEITEVIINGPNQALFRKNGERFFLNGIDFQDIDTYHMFINNVILPMTNTADRIGETSYLIEGQMELSDPEDPNNVIYARVHIVAPPAVESAKVTIAKKARYQFTISDLAGKNDLPYAMENFLKVISKARVTTVISGLSGSGKTTLLEAMSFEFDSSDRVIVVEEIPELRLPLEDVVYLQAKAPRPGQNQKSVVTVEWLASQANRMRPDRIIVGECRSSEMSEFISAANSGADGSLTTIHASSPRQAIDKIVSLVLKDDASKSEASVLRDIASTVQIIIQTHLIDGKHIISKIEEVSNTIRKDGGSIATTTLFEYIRGNASEDGYYEIKNRPSEQLIEYIASRGVPVSDIWKS
jgi:pilus assembly protein CpaF